MDELTKMRTEALQKKAIITIKIIYTGQNQHKKRSGSTDRQRTNKDREQTKIGP